MKDSIPVALNILTVALSFLILAILLNQGIPLTEVLNNLGEPTTTME